MKLFLATFFATTGLCVFLFTASFAVTATGCKSKTAQRQSVNTIASLGYTVDAAFKSYLDLVISGKVPTNSVPQVATSYSLFQSAFNTAITLSVLSSNAPPSIDLQNAASQALLAIKAAKSEK